MAKLAMLFALLSIVALAAANYFEQKCSGTFPHIATHMKNEYGAKCHDGVLVKITPEIEDILTDKFNTQRDKFAKGLVPRFPKKMRRMAKAKYCRELGYYAQLNALRCIYGHDNCHYTEENPRSGQNIARIGKSDSFHEPITVALEQMDDWYNEHKDADYSIIQNYTAGIEKEDGTIEQKQIGHFTALVKEDNFAFGCAIILYTENSWYRHYLVCNYASTNMVGEPICRFSKGEEKGKAGEGCDSGTDTDYKGLCSDDENYKDGHSHKVRTQKPPAEAKLKGNPPKIVPIPAELKSKLESIPRGTGDIKPAATTPVSSTVQPQIHPTAKPSVVEQPNPKLSQPTKKSMIGKDAGKVSGSGNEKPKKSRFLCCGRKE